MPAIYDLGTPPPLGMIPERMHASVIRRERYGEPQVAFQREEVTVPRPGPGEVLVYVMAAGINYNNVWAALGKPLDVIAARAGSAASPRTSTSAARTEPASSGPWATA